MLCNELRGSRPFPVDMERKSRCLDVLDQYNMSMSELALHIGVTRVLVYNVISGKQPSPTTESKIATFLNIPKDFLFPPRTAQEIANMRKIEAEKKARAKKMKAERMEKRKEAQGVA